MSSDAATLAFYQREAPRYTASSAQGPSRHLDAFLDRLEPGARILELGCGGGRDAARMVERGFRVDPTDGTPAMVRKAQERFGLPARVMRFDELCAENEYAGIWAHASLLHSPRRDLARILRRVCRALQPGGWHYANFKLGTGEGRDSLGRLYNFPAPEWLCASYAAVEGWDIVETTTYTADGFDEVARDWLALTLRRARR